MPLIISRTRSLVLPTIGSIVVLSFLLVTNTSGDARNLEISVGVLVDIFSRACGWMRLTQSQPARPAKPV